MHGITNPAEAFFKDGSWSWDGSVWRKQPLVWGFSSVLATSWSTVVSGADGYVDSGPALAGEIWVITTISAADLNTALTEIRVFNRHDGVNITVAHEVRAIAASEYVVWPLCTYLDVDDYLHVFFTGALATDTCVVQCTGYKMKIAE